MLLYLYVSSYCVNSLNDKIKFSKRQNVICLRMLARQNTLLSTKAGKISMKRQRDQQNRFLSLINAVFIQYSLNFIFSFYNLLLRKDFSYILISNFIKIKQSDRCIVF